MGERIRPGTVLDGTYRIVRLIAAGGMGEVYEARHARLAGRYAVKVLHPDVRHHAEVLQRFAREARVTSALRHPGIVQVIDFNTTHDGAPYLVMEFLEGEDLGQVIAREGPLSLARTVRITSQIGRALAAAHRRGVVHRDLKPQNIFLVPGDDDEPERAKVVDFGISKIRSVSQKLTGSQIVLGTPQFMAPEQAEGGDDVDAVADQFALGAIVYEMLTGRPAFTGDTLAAVLYKVVHKDPVPLHRFRPDVPPAVEEVLAVALSKDKRRRFPTTAEFARRLRAAAEETAASGAEDADAPERPSQAVFDREPTSTPGRSGRTLALGSMPSRTPAAAPVPKGDEAEVAPSTWSKQPPPDRKLRTTFGRTTGELMRLRGVAGTRTGKLAIAGSVVVIIALGWGLSRSRTPREGSTRPTRREASVAATTLAPAPPSLTVAVAPGPGTPTKDVPTAAAVGAPSIVPLGPTITPLPSALPAVRKSPGDADAGAVVPFELASEPSGVPLWIDGKPFPSSEQQAHTWARGELSAGTHKLELTKVGYRPWRKVIEVKPGRPNRFLARLEKDDPAAIFADLKSSPSNRPDELDRPLTPPPLPSRSCSMTIGSVPWAELWVDGTNTHRHTPVGSYLAPCGPHKIELKRADLHLQVATDVMLVAGTELKRVLRLEAAGQPRSPRP